MSNQARNLMLLAAEAFQSKDFAGAGTMFAAAMASEDAPEFIADMDRASTEQAEQDVAVASNVEPGKLSLAQIANSVATAMAEEGDDDQQHSATASDDDDEEDDEDDEDADDDSSEDDEDGEGDEDGDADADAEEEDGEDDSVVDDGEEPEANDDLPSSISSGNQGHGAPGMDDNADTEPKTKPRVVISMASAKSPIKLKQ